MVFGFSVQEPRSKLLVQQSESLRASGGRMMLLSLKCVSLLLLLLVPVWTSLQIQSTVAIL